MRAKAPTLILILGLILLDSIPSPLVRVQAVQQSGPTTWSPFGPRIDNLLMTVYADFNAMFTAFTSGQVDLTDWPMQAGQITSLCANADFFCTDSEGEFGIFQLDINRHHAFLGESFLAPRATPVTNLSFTTAASGVCTVGSGTNRFIVNLSNVETGLGINDPMNKVRVVHSSGSPSASVTGTLANNQYTTGCLLAGTYNIDTSVYRGSGSVPTVGPGLDITVSLNAAYNSDSNSQLSAGGINVARALAHLLDKPNFLLGPALGGLAAFDDIQAGPAQGLVPCPLGTPGGCGNNLNGGVPTASQLPQSILDEDLASHAATSIVSAYNLVNDVILLAPWWASSAQPGRGWSGAADIEAACDHLVAAGFAVMNGDCAAMAAVASGASAPACANVAAYTCAYVDIPAGANDQIIMYARTQPARRDYGTIIADSINFLFGTPKGVINNQVIRCVVNFGYLSPSEGCARRYYTIGQLFDVVFSIDQPGGSPPGQNTIDDWNLYTGGWSLGSTPDHLWALYHTDFSGGTAMGGCAGTTEGFPLDYGMYCDPSFDTDSAAGQFSVSLADANGFFSRAATTGHRTVMTIPVYTHASQFVALNAWSFQPGPQSSLVQQLGHGWQTGFWSLLNMRQRPEAQFVCAGSGNPPGCTLNSLYRPGGGNPDLIRRGFSQEVHKLSLFHGLTVWDFEVMGQIYDSMLAVSPRTGAAGAQVIDWMTTSHSQTFSATEVCTLPDGTSFTGCTTQTWRLRNDIKFQNGAAVTANDVCFSALTFQNVPSSNLQASASTVASCRVLNSKTVQVKHILQSAFYELNTGGLPILPASLWAGLCNWPGALHDSTTIGGLAAPVDVFDAADLAVLQASSCGNPAFDPMQAGMMVGSGPWVCKSPAGVVGGPCTSSGTQDVVLGETITLKRNRSFERCCPDFQDTSLQKISWADGDDNGAISILDVADAALVFGSANAYWDHPLFGATNGVVDIGEIATVAFYFDHGLTKPFAPASLTSIDPEIDPFISQGILAQGCKREQVGAGQQRVVCVVAGNTAANNGDLTGQANVLNQPGTFNSATGKTGYIFNLATFPPGDYKFKIQNTNLQLEFTV